MEQRRARNLAKKVKGFVWVGALCFTLDYGGLIGLQALGMPVVAAAAVSYIASLLVNYALSMRFVFDGARGRAYEFCVFCGGSLVGLGLNEAIIWAGTEFFGDGFAAVSLSKVAATATVMVWNFCTRYMFLDADSPLRGENEKES